MTRIYDNLFSPDVPALLVTPPENPDSIGIELIGSATFKNLGRRQDQNRVKKSKKEETFITRAVLLGLDDRYPGYIQCPTQL